MYLGPRLFLVVAASLLGLVASFVASVIAAIPVCLLWNWLVPDIIGWQEINLLEAWGLSFLAAILLKNHPNVKIE